MIIKAIDHGYLYTKDNDFNLFKSAYERSDMTLTGKNKIIINSNTFYFGSGLTTTDSNKIDSNINMIGTLAIMAMTGQDEYVLVTGLPISQYKDNKEKFKETILGYNKFDVVFDNKPFKPMIKDVVVFAQGVGALYNIGLPDGEYISFDIGSYTINVILVEIINGIPYIIKWDTWYDGILTLFSKIIFETNKRFNTTLDVQYAEKIINRGFLHVNGEKQDIEYVKLIIADYIEGIFSKFKPNYPYATESIIFSGGGSIMFIDFLLNHFNNSIVLPNSQFANATGYYNFGVQKYGHLLGRGCVNA